MAYGEKGQVFAIKNMTFRDVTFLSQMPIK
jgi:hypothetical protein